MLQLDTSPHLSHVRPDTESGPGPREVMTMPGPVSRLLYGPLAVTYIAETISLSLIIEMLVKVIGRGDRGLEILTKFPLQISHCCQSVSMLVLEELMKLYTSSNSSELRNLSTFNHHR